MHRSGRFLICLALLGLGACYASWRFETALERTAATIVPADVSVGVSAVAQNPRDLEVLKVAIEGELVTLGVFRSVVRSCAEADLCLAARVFSQNEPEFEDLAADLSGVSPSILSEVIVARESGNPVLSFILGASRSGGLARLESGSGTITIIGTEIARQVADRVRNAE